MFTRSEINQARHSLTRGIINSGYSFHLFSSQDIILKVKAVATDTWTNTTLSQKNFNRVTNRRTQRSYFM